MRPLNPIVLAREAEDHPSSGAHASLPRPPCSALRADAGELLMALHAEFYSGPLAHADAFRILPRVVGALEENKRMRETLAIIHADAHYICVEWLRDNGHEQVAKCVENIRLLSKPNT